jgi:hypothetical protein
MRESALKYRSCFLCIVYQKTVISNSLDLDMQLTEWDCREQVMDDMKMCDLMPGVQLLVQVKRGDRNIHHVRKIALANLRSRGPSSRAPQVGNSRRLYDNVEVVDLCAARTQSS